MQSGKDIVAKMQKQSSGGKWKEPTASNQQRRGNGTGRSRPSRAHETEDEALIRRFHDAQRMARFRARKKKALEAACAAPDEPPGRGSEAQEHTESRYSELLAVLERLGKDVRLSYAGSRSSAERLKSGIARARALVRDCLAETTRASLGD